MQVEGWGRYPRYETDVVRPGAPAAVPSCVVAGDALIARGNGRAYGDAAIGERLTLLTTSLARMCRFDPASGRLTVEAGVLLADILETFVPRGFFPPVVPGTKLVTVGGMIAADVHGKNHHLEGGFGDHVDSLVLVTAKGEVVACSREANPALFQATIGGMGLTGVIVEATFRLRRIETGWIMQRTLVADDLRAALRALDATANTTYSVAWIDCVARGASLGRSLVLAGEHATRAEVTALPGERELLPAAPAARLGVPIELPSWTLNRLSVAAFNALYFRHGLKQSQAPALTHWNPFFFPLDGIADWNRIYGRRGFVQHQCVLPEAAAEEVLGDVLERIAGTGRASFLAVLKKLKAGNGLLSFPMAGYTLALDLHVDDDIFVMLTEIDAIVAAAGGRLYLAKDARQSRRTFEAGYPRLDDFKRVRRELAAERKLASRLSMRLGL